LRHEQSQISYHRIEKKEGSKSNNRTTKDCVINKIKEVIKGLKGGSCSMPIKHLKVETASRKKKIFLWLWLTLV